MNVLEKILEEIDNRKSYHEEKAYKQDDYEIQKMYCSEELDWITNIIRSHMNDIENDGWIPVKERLPNEAEFVKAYCRNHYCAEFIVMIEGATRPTTLYYKNRIWADENNNQYRVVAWQPLPKEYNPVEE